MEFKDYTETAHVAALIETHQNDDLTVSHMRYTIRVELPSTGAIPAYVGDIARKHGFVFDRLIASTAHFKHEDERRVQA